MRGQNSFQKRRSSLLVSYADQILKTLEGRYVRRPRALDQMILSTETDKECRNRKSSEIYLVITMLREGGLHLRIIQVMIRGNGAMKNIFNHLFSTDCKNIYNHYF